MSNDHELKIDDLAEIFSDAHPEYLEDDSDHHDAVNAKPAEEQPPHQDAPPAKSEGDHHDDKEVDADAGTMQEWILKLGLFGAGCVLILWFVSRRRKHAYEMLKQDEKSTA